MIIAIMNKSLEKLHSGHYEAYKRHKRYKQKLKEFEENRPKHQYIEQKYFNCISCGKINLVEDILNEETENRTMRTRYLTWNKFKRITSEMNGNMENCLNYLMYLHEQRQEGGSREDREVGIAGIHDDEK